MWVSSVWQNQAIQLHTLRLRPHACLFLIKNTIYDHHFVKSIRKVVQRNIKRLYIVMLPRFVHFTADIFPGCKVEQGMTCFQIVPILPPLRDLFTVKKGVKPGMMTPKNKDTGAWNALSPCLDTMRGKLNHSQGTGPDSGIRGLLSQLVNGWLT